MATTHIVQSAPARAIYDAYEALVPTTLSPVHARDARTAARGAATLLLSQLEANPEGMRRVLTAALTFLSTTPTVHDYLNVQMGS